MKHLLKSLASILLLTLLPARAAIVDLGIQWYSEYPVSVSTQGYVHNTFATAFSATRRGGDQLPDGHSSPFITFCTDINYTLANGMWKSGGFNDLTLTAQSSPAIRQPDSLYRASNLYNHFSFGIMNPNGTWANKLEGSALQLSIWEVLYETEPVFDVRSGTGFIVTSGASSILDRANQMLGSSFSDIDKDYILTFWDACNADGSARYSQDLIGPTLVPEPSTWISGCFLIIPCLMIMRRIK